MQIDWLTVAAQAVNFLILVYLLRRFLYRPVMAAMARREARIAQQLEEARTREQLAEQEARRYREKIDAFDRERDAQLAALAKDVAARKKSMLDEARADVDTVRATWQKEVERERQEFSRTFRRQAGASITETARRVLSDLADARLEEQLIGVFVKQLESMDHGLMASLRKSAHKAAEINVTTSFEADADTRSRIKRAIQHHLLEGREMEVEFRHSDDLICGIEVNTDGRKLGWTIADHLQALEADLDRTLARTRPPEPQRDA